MENSQKSKGGNMKKILTIIAIALIVVVVFVAVGKNTIAKVAVEAGVKAVTGLKLNIQSLNIGIIDFAT